MTDDAPQDAHNSLGERVVNHSAGEYSREKRPSKPKKGASGARNREPCLVFATHSGRFGPEAGSARTLGRAWNDELR
jgi:hypothetical protein